MIMESPRWPMANLGERPVLMTVDEIEEFAPDIPCVLDADATLEDALRVPGGLAIYCHRKKLKDQAAGLSAVNSHRRLADDT